MIDNWKKGAKYWDHAWNPMIGCEEISEGCQNCYAARLADQYPELRDENGGFSPHLPKHLKKPPKDGVVFVGNMTDIFGEWNAPLQIVHWLTSLSDGAQNLILTKRAARMADFLRGIEPIRQAWFGVTAENQERLDERFSLLFGNVKKLWLSLEPLLGQIDLSRYIIKDRYYAVRCEYCGWAGSSEYCPGGEDYFTCPRCYKGEPQDVGYRTFRWVVVGAESGPDSVRRPCKIEWVENIVEQCRSAGVPVFVKQLDLNGTLVKDISKFPSNLQLRQVPWGEKE